MPTDIAKAPPVVAAVPAAPATPEPPKAPDVNWEEKYNLWSGLCGGFFLHLAYFGCDFSQAQRILTSRTQHESRYALLLSAFAKVPMQALKKPSKAQWQKSTRRG